MGLPAVSLSKYNYAEYLTWNDDKRWEIIGGEVYDMSPAPNLRHQRISGKLSLRIGTFLKGNKCEMFVAPFDVRLADDYSQDVLIENVVQPDILVYCDKRKLDMKGGKGAPDFIIEILSPFTALKDLTKKMLLYQLHKVKEYWIVDPETENIMQFILNKNNFFNQPIEYSKNKTIASVVLKGLSINLKPIFAS